MKFSFFTLAYFIAHCLHSIVLQPTLMDGGNYIKEGADDAKSTWLIFSPSCDDEAGSLADALVLFKVIYY